jgi:hypothetical protein
MCLVEPTSMVAAARGSGHPAWHIALVFGAPVAMWLGLEAYQWWTRSAARRAQSPRTPLLVLTAVASAAGGAVHALVCPEHFHEAVAFGVFFAVVSAAQLSAAIVLVARPSRRILTAIAFGNAAVIAVWAVSRTIGVPIGPTPWQPEAIGGADKLAVLLEIAVVTASWRLLATRVATTTDGAGRRRLGLAPPA